MAVAAQAGSQTIGAMAGAAFTSLVQISHISLINNKGDIAKTFKDLGSKDNVKRFAFDVISAGITQKIEKNFAVQVGQDKLKFSDQMLKMLVQSTSNSLLQTAIYNTDLDENLTKNLRLGLAGIFNQEIFGRLVKPLDENDIGFINNTKHKLAAALTGCISAEIAKNDCESAALGAMIGEMWADRKIDNPNILTDKQRQQIINESRLAASFAAFIFDKDINTAADMAGEAVRWNSTARIMLGHEWNQITDDTDGTYAKEQLQAIKDIPDNLAELSENITYLKNSNNDFIICVRTTTQSCLPKQGQRYATQNEISEGYRNFILDIIPIPGGTSAKAVVKKSGRVVSEAVVNKPANNIGKNNANYRRDRHEKITAKGIQTEKVNELRKLFDENNASKSIKIGNKTLHQEANSSGLTRIFKGASDEEVKRYFMDLTGQPLPKPIELTIRGKKGVRYTVQTSHGNYTLRDISKTENQTGPVWTIDVPKGLVHKTKQAEIKFLRR